MSFCAARWRIRTECVYEVLLSACYLQVSSIPEQTVCYVNVCSDIRIIKSRTFFECCCDVLQDYWFIVASRNQMCNWKSYSDRRTERLTLPLFWAMININECGILWPIPTDAQLQINSSVRKTLPNILWSRYWNVIICCSCTGDIDCETHPRLIITPLNLLFCGPIRCYRLSKAQTYKWNFCI